MAQLEDFIYYLNIDLTFHSKKLDNSTSVHQKKRLFLFLIKE